MNVRLLTLRILLRAVVVIIATHSVPASASDIRVEPCRLKGVSREVRCGAIERPENPDSPDGRKISIRFAIVPALAKNKAPDPVFFFAGGPGQGATQVAAQLLASQSQLNIQRDLVFVDQRGTGRSNKLGCPTPPSVAPLAAVLDTSKTLDRLERCIEQASAQGNDLRQYATWIAMRDIDAVRAALGATKINLWGASYGTRAALDYLRQFPDHVRSVVLDGVAPATMVLPTSFALDNDAALTHLIALCDNDARCRGLYPHLAADIDQLLHDAAAGSRRVTVTHPISGQREQVTLDRDAIASALRAPLYAPPLAATLPYAITRAAAGEFDALITLMLALSSSASETMAEVMHFAVICAEDMPRLETTTIAAAERTRFAERFDTVYRRLCPKVPVRPVPAEFYAYSKADVPVLLLSGGVDPATPPRHGDAVAKQLKNAHHLVALNLGHGVAHHGCAPELILKFVRQASFDKIDGTCLTKLPSPTIFAAPAAQEHR